MTHQDLLLEIGCAELPAKLLCKLAAELNSAIRDGLTAAGITFNEENSALLATPRRLAVLIKAVSTQQPDQRIERRGPALNAAYTPDGKPTPALQGFLKSCHITEQELIKEETPKGTWLVYRGTAAGKKTADLLPNIINAAIKKLPIPKPMRWGEGQEAFVRPVYWAVLLLGETVVPATVLGKQTDRTTYGHRFLAPQALTINHPQDYIALLEKANVIVDVEKRKNSIIAQANALATAKQATIKMDENLLTEVCGLVEWPVALLANFEKEFLTVPQEALIAAMQDHQKCFPLLDAKGKLLPHFITISNIASHNPPQVIEGNEKVMRARLSDAKFFYELDSQHQLSDSLARLKTITFQKDLGSLYDKATRIAKLAQFISAELKLNNNLAEKAGQLAKADLATSMVSEFPELQGIMGSYYALNSGENEAVATAIREHYQPKFAGDALPSTDIACTVSLADKIDTLVGVFGIGQKPTGEKDPFGLRRAAIGVIRIIIEKNYSLNLEKILQKSFDTYDENIHFKNNEATVVNEVSSFIFERLRFYYKEQNIDSDLFNAVHAVQNTDLCDFEHLMRALQAFLPQPAAASLIAGNKRVNNILKQAQEKNIKFSEKLAADLLTNNSEKALWDLIQKLGSVIQLECSNKDYPLALNKLAEFKNPIDNFFDKEKGVMVMVEDSALRDNRLSLLHQLKSLFLKLADFSLLN